MSAFFAVAVAVAVALATSCAMHRWPVSSPAAESVDPAVLDAVDGELRAGAFGYVDSMLIVRHGRIVAEHHYEHDYRDANAGRDATPRQYNYYHPDWHPFYQGTDLHSLQSVTKSVTSVLVGIAIHQGAIAGTDVPVLSFFDDRDVADPDGRKAAITLEDVLTMRAGIAWDEWSVGLDDPRNDCIQLEARDDWIGFVLDKEMAADPGTVFVYNSGASHLLSGVIAKATGQTIDRYAQRHLFGPLGIERYHWKKTPAGLPDTEGGLYLTPRDLAKIGLLMLGDGVWNGRRLLPPGWVERSVTPWVEDISPDNGRRDPGYGYKWWVVDAGGGAGSGAGGGDADAPGDDGRPKLFAAMGYGGQYLLVAPELDLIGVFTGWNIYGHRADVVGLFRERVVPAARRQRPVTTRPGARTSWSRRTARPRSASGAPRACATPPRRGRRSARA